MNYLRKGFFYRIWNLLLFAVFTHFWQRISIYLYIQIYINYVYVYTYIYINDKWAQKVESFLSPLIDQFAKEGKDKKVVFEARFSKPNCKPKWLFRKDVSNKLTLIKYILYICAQRKWKAKKDFIMLKLHIKNIFTLWWPRVLLHSFKI